jgi:hypothetical protein
MQWLVHAPPVVAEALIKHEHKTHVSDADPLETARANQWDLITTDAATAMRPFSDEKLFRRSVVFLQLTGGDAELSDAVDRLFVRYKRLTPGRLYTVTASRVKVRQLPQRRGLRTED